MDVPTDRIDPQPPWPVVTNPFASAAVAFAAGNYPLALDMAPAGSALRAAAMVMCGATAPGLTLLAAFDSAEMRLVRAYAHWCLDQAAEARRLLASLAATEMAAQAATLDGLLAGAVEIVLISMPESSHSGRFHLVDEFRVHSIQLGPERFGTSMTDAIAALPTRMPPRLILSINAFGPYLPQAPRAPGIPLVIWGSDHDFFFATRYVDYARADVIAVNSAAEQTEMARHYSGRVAAFPAYETYLQNPDRPPRAKRDTDILFTGRAFTPYMRDKAQLLFRLATLDDPALTVDITDGYLHEPEYVATLARARHVPTFWRYAGGLQTRAIEALRSGARVLVPEAGLAQPLLGAAAPAYRSIVEADVGPMLHEPARTDGSAAKDLDALFWSSPARETRFLKFCLFQTILAGPLRQPAPEPSVTPAEQRAYPRRQGVGAYTRLVGMNSETDEPTAAHFNYAASAAFYAAILVPEAPAVGKMALDFYRAGVEAFPSSLVLRFNAARAFWTFGLKAEAIAAFHAIVEQLPDLSFDARSDALLSHRVRVLAQMFPYGDFFRAAVAPADSRNRSPGPREFVASAALAYLAADFLERNEPAAAVALLQRAVERCEINVAAWRLLASALARALASPPQIRTAFYRAVNLYPPELLDLLAIGVEAELADGRVGPAAQILRSWVLMRTRIRDAQGRPIAAADESVAAARRYRALLSDWTGGLLDRMVGTE